MGTPKGRQRYREMLNTSPTPSPSRGGRASRSPFMSQKSDIDVSDDDDEETLQLKLQAIEARLKLKRLQKSKASPSQSNSRRPVSDSPSMPQSESQRLLGSPIAPRRNLEPKSPQEAVQVPASPVRKFQDLGGDPSSPTRVRLGIDKGLTAKDISLKRAPNYKRPGSNVSLARSADIPRSSTSASASQSDVSRPTSFSERLASMRTEEHFRKERQAKIKSVRSNAFGIGKEEMEKYKETAVEIPDEPLLAPSYSREDVMAGGVPRSKTASTLSRPGTFSTDDANGDQPASFESYSGFHLARRVLPHNVLARHVHGKAMFSIKDILRDIKAPDFNLPEVEEDIVVFAILAKKSDPRSHKPPANKKAGVEAEEKGKYMIMTLVDLEFELDLYLFDTGFSRFWKLTEGTVIAILNPNIMPPPPGRKDTGRFSLVINSDADTIIEVGVSRDIGSCQSVKKDGELCGSWINKKRTNFCEYHSNEAVRKQRSSRIEMNSSGFGNRDRSGGGGGGDGGFEQKLNWGKKNKNYDWETRSQFFSSRSMSTADLIDGKSRDMSNEKDKAEFLKRNMEAKEREREMMKRLGKIGNAAGKDYMQYSGSRDSGAKLPRLGASALPSSDAEGSQQSIMDTDALGIGRAGRTIHLSPIKRKRPDSSDAGSTSSRRSGVTAPYGWGGNLKDKLSSMKAGEKLIKEQQQPQRKKTRFVTDKGIREAGRESIGLDYAQRQVSLDDDDDDEELLIVQ